MPSPSNRGKFAEGKVHQALALIESKCLGFTYNRVLDSHAAGGKFVAQAGDFQAFKAGNLGLVYSADNRNWVIEVKETSHGFRLPHKNFTADKVARMYKRALAGSEPVVLIYHTEVKLWRSVPFEVFRTREGGSWDLSKYPIVALESELRRIFDVAQT